MFLTYLKGAFLFIFITLGMPFSSYAQSVQAFFNQYEGDSYYDSYKNVNRRGHDLEKVILDAIEQADKSIEIAVQEIRLPKIAKALVAKYREGVDVKLILESDYNYTILESPRSNQNDEDHEGVRYTSLFIFIDANRDGKITNKELKERDAMYIIKKAGLPIKDDRSYGRGGSGIMHHKFVIIDKKLVLVSSANFTMSGIHGDIQTGSSRGNANALLKFKSKKMAKIFGSEFDILWGNSKGKVQGLFALDKPYRGRFKAKIGSTQIVTQFSPTSRYLSWEKSVNGLIGETLSKAKKSVDMALFVFSDQKITDVLKKKNNIQFGLMIEPRFAYRYYSEMLDIWGIQMRDENCQYEIGNNPWNPPFLKAGVPFLPSGDMLHHKYAVVDDETVIFGSQNWSESANRINDENVLIIRNKKIAEQFTEEFERIARNSRLGPSKALLRRINTRDSYCKEKLRYLP